MSEERFVIIGGVAAAMSAASQIKRRKSDAEVVVLERGHDVSYGACGMPYNLADPDRDVNDLVVMSVAGMALSETVVIPYPLMVTL